MVKFSQLLIICLLFSNTLIVAQNGSVGINNNDPHSSAALDITSTDKGILIPRIALTAANVASPVNAPAHSLLVYNNATSGEGQNAVVPGFYSWDSLNSRWVQMNQEPESNNGLGTWGDCDGSMFTNYNPVGVPGGTESNNGYCVAMDDEYAISGSPYDTAGGFEFAGSAWIYKRTGNTWALFQELTQTEPELFKVFGVSVDIDGEYAVVGAAFDDHDGFEDVGAVYIFHFNGTNWIQQTELHPDDVSANMFFGYDVAIDSNRVVVGIPGANFNDINTGRASVYERTGATWVLVANLIASDGQTGDQFGVSVDIYDDMVLLGANRADINGETNAGAAYFFRHSLGSWEESQKKHSTTPQANGDFGRSVAMNDELSIIGAPSEQINGNNGQGSGYIFQKNNNLWEFEQSLHNSSGSSSDAFGSSVTVDDIYIMVGSPFADEGQSDCGEATLFTDIGGVWKRVSPNLHDPTTEQGDNFGSDVAIRNKHFMIGAMGMLGKGLVVFGKF